MVAYHEALGTMGYYTVTATINHIDPLIVLVTLDGETLDATPDHAFCTFKQNWVGAADL